MSGGPTCPVCKKAHDYLHFAPEAQATLLAAGITPEELEEYLAEEREELGLDRAAAHQKPSSTREARAERKRRSRQSQKGGVTP